MVSQLPPDDQTDMIQVGPVDSIPAFHEDDPRLEDDRRLWSSARAQAQAMTTAEELLAGLQDRDWRVRHETVDRLVARARDDDAWQVRDAVAMTLHEFDRERVVPALISATIDPHPEVRSSAKYSLAQLGVEGAVSSGQLKPR